MAAHGLMVVPKALPQSLLAPWWPLAGVLGSWVDVDSYGWAGALARSAMFAVQMAAIAAVVGASRRSESMTGRAVGPAIVGLFVIAVAAFWAVRALLEASM